MNLKEYIEEIDRQFRTGIAREHSYRPDELQPSEPIHPGEMLKDELAARALSQKKFAELINMPYTAFNEIINGKRPITTDTALKPKTVIRTFCGVCESQFPTKRPLICNKGF